jgi:ankyrin repeat protein
LYGFTALIAAFLKGDEDVIRTLLEGGADINAKCNVRNQIMMMIIIIILLSIMMLLMMMIVIYDKDRDDCR